MFCINTKFHSLHSKDTRARWIECRAIGMSHDTWHEPRIFAWPRKLLTAVQQTRVQDRVRRKRKNLKLFLMSHARSFGAAIASLTLTGGSVEDMLGAVQATDVDWNIVLRMWCRITQAHRLLRLP